MPISLTCTGCKTKLKVRDDLAGRKVKCPRCAGVLVVPAAKPKEEEVAPVELVEERVTEAPAGKGRKGAIRRGDDDEPRGGRHRGGIKTDGRPSRKRGRLDDDDSDERSQWKPCPKCKARGAKRVLWTPWGSFYGPALFHHVRCPACGYKYNGRTGRSNLVPAVIFVTVAVVGIVGILVGLFVMLHMRGYI
ncbi:MAG: hypothetical protein U0736_01040 [Gemmataceae bacterium]